MGCVEGRLGIVGFSVYSWHLRGFSRGTPRLEGRDAPFVRGDRLQLANRKNAYLGRGRAPAS